jgi:sugar lactone lactonase YvrE
MPRAAIVALALAACGSAPQVPTNPAAAPPDPAVAALIGTVDRELATRPDDGMLIYLRAALAVEAGAHAEAWPYVERLEAAGWDVPFGRDLEPLADDPRYAPIAQRVAGRAPVVRRSRVAFEIAGPDLIPEGIAVDSRTGTFYVGSIRKRMIVAVDRDGVARTFVPPRHAGQLAVLGVKVDEARDQLWATSYASSRIEGADDAKRTDGGLRAYALGDGTVQRSIEFGDGEKHLPNDIAIAGDGTVYVTDSATGRVWRVPIGRDVLEPVTPANALAYPNGIALGPDGTLYVTQVTGIAIVDPTSGTIRPLDAAPGVWLGAIDGLLRDGSRLLAVQNLGKARLVAFELDETGQRAIAQTVLDNDDRLLEMPTTSCIWDGALYTIANAQLRAFGPQGLAPGVVLRDPQIVRTPLP